MLARLLLMINKESKKVEFVYNVKCICTVSVYLYLCRFLYMCHVYINIVRTYIY